MKNNNRLVPRLRFKEFSGEWEEKKLENFLDYLQPTKYLVKSEDYNDKYETPVLTAGKSFILGYTNEKEGVFKENLPVIIFDDFTTATQFVDFPFKAKSSAMKLLTAKENHNIKFYYELMQTINFEVAVHQRHWISLFSKFDVPTTSLPEQQKIADTLSSLDILIENEQAKLAQLQEHKKGLMQNLFPQEGESIPKVRFKEFENDGEWEEKELGALIDIKGRIGYRGYTLKDIVDKGEGAISMSPSNIDDNQTLSFEKSTYITWDKYYESPEIILKDGYTVLVKTGSSYGKVAFIKDLIEKTTINPQLVVLKPEKMVDYFLFLLIASSTVQELINQTVVGGAIPTLSQKSISEFEVFVPSLNEQQRIADTLSSLNNLISAQTERIELLQQHKKGLIQGLFPNKNKYE